MNFTAEQKRLISIAINEQIATWKEHNKTIAMHGTDEQIETYIARNEKTIDEYRNILQALNNNDKVYVVTDNAVINDEIANNSPKVFNTLSKAQEYLEDEIFDFNLNKTDWLTEITDYSFCAYEDGNYNGNHIHISIEELTIQ